MANSEIVNPFAPGYQSAVDQPQQDAPSTGIVNPFSPTYTTPKGAFTRGISDAVQGLKGVAGGVVAAAGDAVGADSVKQYGLDVAKRAATANAGEPPPPSAMGIRSIGDLANFAKYGLGYAVPNALAAVAAGVVGRAGGSLLSKGVADAAEAMWLKNAGAVAGLEGSNIAQQIGMIYPEAVDHKVDNPLARSVIGGVAAGTLATLPETYIAARAGALGKSLASTGSVQNMTLNALKEAGIAGTGAAVTGAAQTAVQRAASGQDLTGDEATQAYIENAALGAVGGAAAGGIAGTLGHVASKESRVQDNVQPRAAEPLEQNDVGASTDSVGAVDPITNIATPEQKPLGLDMPAEQMTLQDNSPAPISETQQKYFDTVGKQKELQDRLAALEAEKKQPDNAPTKSSIEFDKNAPEPKRSDALIDQEHAAVTEQLANVSEQAKNYETLLNTPEYSEKTRPIGESTPDRITGSGDLFGSGDSPRVLTDEQQRTFAQAKPAFTRSAEDIRAINNTPTPMTSEVPAAQNPSIVIDKPNNQRSRVVYDAATRAIEDRALQAEAERNPPTKSAAQFTEPPIPSSSQTAQQVEAIRNQLAISKKNAGQLLSADEAHVLHRAEAIENASQPRALEIPNVIEPRATFKQGDITARREAMLDTGSKLVDSHVAELVNSGLIKNQKAADTIKSGLNRAVEDMIGTKDIESAKAALEDGIERTLKGKITEVDRQTISDNFVKSLMDQPAQFVNAKPNAPLTDTGSLKLYSKAFVDTALRPDILESRALMTPAQLDGVLTVKGQQAISYLNRIIGNPANLEVRTFKATSPEQGAGSIRLDKVKSVIELAINASDAGSVAAHEGYHYLEHKVLSSSEQKVVANSFKPGAEMFDRLMEKASEYDKQNGTKISDEIAAIPAEARAYGFEFWRRGELDTPSALGRFFDKIKNVIDRIGNAVKGLGFQTHDDIFSAIDRGRYAQDDGNPFRTLNLDAEPIPSDPIKLMSRSALEDLAVRSKNGEVPTSQLHGKVADLLGDKTIPEGLRERIFKNGSGELKGTLNSLKRAYLENISSGLNLARRSLGYKNVFDVLTTYTQRKNRLISDNVENRLSSWVKGSSTEDQRTVSSALLDRTVNNYTKGSAEYSALYAKLNDKQKTMFDQATGMIAHTLDEEFKAEQKQYARILGEDSEQYKEWLGNRATQVEQLKAQGYFPERRYGDHIVHSYIEGADGKKITLYYAQHEREADARTELPNVAKAFADEPAVKTEYGYKYKADYDGSLSMQQFLDLANRNGINLAQGEKERLAKALVSADSTRRNRIFRRQNVAGFSENGMRVLAEHGVAIANKVTYSELSHALSEAMSGKQVETRFNPDGSVKVDSHEGTDTWAQDGEMSGFYRNLADKTADFVMSPKEGSKLSSGLRAAASIQFLGGSLSAGAVQLASIPMNTVPWLTQHTSYTDALGKTVSSFKTALANMKDLTDIPTLLDKSKSIPGIDTVEGLRDAMATAAQDGTILDTEIHQIMGLARGQEYSFNGKTRAAIQAWMSPFQKTEQINRLTTFIAAYKIAKDKNLSNDEAYKLAQDTVHGTQFRYDEANRPAIARSPVGALLFTFKSYPIFMTETIAHLAKEKPAAAVAMLASLTMMAGIEGMPFAQDIEDIVDTIAYRLFNSPFNSKRALRNVLKSASEAVTGTDLSSIGAHGLANELTGMNFASRVGLGDIIPGTRIGTADADYKKVVSEALGPVGSMVTGVLHGFDSINQGQYVDAMKQALPLAAQNLVKGAEQWQHGFASDIGGRKLVNVSGPEAFWQALGFSSNTLTKAYEMDRIDKEHLAFYQQAKQNFMTDLTKAIVTGDKERASEAIQAVVDWNKNNPDMIISMSPDSTRKALQQAGLPLDSRTYLKMPKALRGSSMTAIGLDHNNQSVQ